MIAARRRLLLAVVAGSAGARAQPLAAPGVPAELGVALPGARLQGSGRLRYFGLGVYDIRLWTGGRAVGGDWTAAPCALELAYLRDFRGGQIAERSLVEMRRQGEVDAATAERWLATMKALFPDVRPGDRLTALHQPGVGARYFHNAGFIGETRDPEFVRTFLGIWLAPQTSEPALREALLGGRR